MLSIIAQDNTYIPEYKYPSPTTPNWPIKVNTYPTPAKIGNVIMFTTNPGQNIPIAYNSRLSTSYIIENATPPIMDIWNLKPISEISSPTPRKSKK